MTGSSDLTSSLSMTLTYLPFYIVAHLEKEQQVVCHASVSALAMTDEVRREAIFITSVSSCKSLKSFTNRYSPDISFAPSSLALLCFCEVLHDLSSDHLPILLNIPLSPVFRHNKHPLFFNFQKACWDDFASYFGFHCPSAEEYSSLSLSLLLWH